MGSVTKALPGYTKTFAGCAKHSVLFKNRHRSIDESRLMMILVLISGQ